jgi:hypothetical protein
MSEVDSRNEVEIDLEKYDQLINNLHDKEKEIARMKADAEAQKKAIGPRKKRRVLDIFLDDNDVNEKAIVGLYNIRYNLHIFCGSYIRLFWYCRSRESI